MGTILSHGCLALLVGLTTSCGSKGASTLETSDRVVSVDESRSIQSLSPAEIQQSCTELLTWRAHRQDTSEGKRVACVIAGQFAAAKAITPSKACRDKLDACMALPATPKKETCAFQASQGCALTVGDITKCAVAAWKAQQDLARRTDEEICSSTAPREESLIAALGMSTPECSALAACVRQGPHARSN
jgi:hypothetical protein